MDEMISRQAVLKLLSTMPPEEAITQAMLIQSVKQMSAADCISRRAAIDEIVNTVSEIGLHDNSEVARYGATFRQHEIIDIIEGMPSAQPERKRGKWKMDLKRHVFVCSICGAWQVFNCNYCSNCGTDMREVDE